MRTETRPTIGGFTNISLIHIDDDSFYNHHEPDLTESDMNNQLINESTQEDKISFFSYFTDSSVFGTSFNFINSIIGSGVIGMAYAISLSGIGISLFILPLVAILTDYSILILISTGEKAGVKTYQDLVYQTIGKYGTYFLILAQFLYPFIGLISYNIIIGDTITKVFMRLFKVSTTSILSQREFIIVISSLFVTLPLSLLKNISNLAKTSFLSCILLVFIFLIMINRYFIMKDYVLPTPSAYRFVNNYEKVVDSFSIMAFAFMCHHNSFLIFHSMEKPTLKNWKIVSHISISFSVCFSFFFGLVGYMTFTNLTEGDIFENYCYKDDLINVARLAYALIIMCSFPLEAFVCRDVVVNTFFTKRKDSYLIHVILTVTIIIFSILFSFTTSCLGVVLELNGALVATNLAYIMPSLCALFYNYKNDHKIKNYIVPVLIFLFGMVINISGMVSIIDKIKDGYSCSKGVEYAYCLKSNNLTHFKNS